MVVLRKSMCNFIFLLYVLSFYFLQASGLQGLHFSYLYNEIFRIHFNWAYNCWSILTRIRSVGSPCFVQPADIWLSSISKGWQIWALPGWGGEFEPDVSSFQRNTIVLSFNMEALKGQLKLAREWLRSKHMQGLDFKTWTMNRKSWSLILHLKRNVPSNPVFE